VLAWLAVLHVEDLGIKEYEDAHALQQERLEARIRRAAPDTLYLLEHPPVVTLGRGTNPGNLRDPDRFPVVESERGGDVTLHAPGQLVGYLIRLLPEGQRDLHAHLRLLEEIVIQSIAPYEVTGNRRDGATGVWVENRKIASLGVACRNWCTWHGFALNIDLPLEQFSVINPCGFEAHVMTSLAKEAASPPSITDVKAVLADVATRLVASPR